MADDRHAHWETVYQTKRDDEVSWFQARPTLSEQLVTSAARSADAAIVDVGGGASRLVDALTARGFTNVTVLDLSETALAVARARLGRAGEAVTWLAGDVLAHAFPPASMDVWHDRAVFHFLVEPAEQAAYAAQARAAIRTGGTLIVQTFAPDGPQKCSGLPVCRHTAESLQGVFADGFDLRGHGHDAHRTPSGALQPFVWAVFTRR